ncbi:stage II sporulation protein M [Papillibacter cinnamivorans]|uniref:Stage II sporulation protein M n=1 Tax=Papillibacter cinnamivorans DSM 12816 TaxID=1122930 RepID=A0A1W2CH64_9FIRM|nr:stage II sporulation protein M [Papillibacter cinnamivorans]SMC84406.1 stage II sporulation protein M [Papillibacter cinnamivorans DSM 12816]
MRLSRTFRRIWTVPVDGMATGLLILSVLFAAGAVAGHMIPFYIGDAGDEELKRYIAGYLALSRQDTLSVPDVFTVFLNFYRYPLIAFFFGFTSLGVVGIPVLAAVRGFFLSFAVSCFAKVFGSEGIALAAVAFGVQCLVTLPCFFLIAAQAFSSSARIASVTAGRKRRGRGELYGNGYFLRCAICAGILLGGALAEIFITPWVLSLMAGGMSI